MHKCSEVLKNLDKLRNRDELNMTKHKEEKTLRGLDRTKLKNLLLTCILPLQSESYILTSICNICTGQIAEKSVNVKNALEIGKKQMKSFQRSLPEGLRLKIKREVVTMKTPKEAKKK